MELHPAGDSPTQVPDATVARKHSRTSYMNRHERRAQTKHSGTKPTRLLNPAGQREFDSAVQLMQQGRWPESAAAHRRVLSHNARHSPALHHLGLIAFKSGQVPEAIQSLRLALGVEPNYVEARLNLAVILKMHGDLSEALIECRKVISDAPKNAAAHAELGNILKDLGQPADAISAYRHALAHGSDALHVHSSLALCLAETRQTEDAVVVCRKILMRDPAHAVASKRLIRGLAALGRMAEVRTAINGAGGNDEERTSLVGDAALGLHKAGQTSEAIALIRDGIQHAPNPSDLYLLLGSILNDCGRLSEAFDALKDGLDRDPSRADGYVTLGFVLFGQGARDGAVTALEHACTLRPDMAAAHYVLGSVLRVMGRFEDARAALERAIACDPRAIDARLALSNVRRSMCDWDGLDAQEAECLAEIRASGTSVTPFLLLGMNVSNDDMREAGKRYTRDLISKVPVSALARPYQTHVTRPEKIKIGYVSSDFGHHATSILLAEVLEMHDRDRFDIIGYCHSPEDNSALRHRVIAAFDDFVRIADTGHYAVADKIRDDGIEILVDLKGYTSGARQEIFALRPAPIQVSYLGYPATTGASYLDYVLADSVVAPMAHQADYSERIVHIGACYQPNDRRRVIDPNLVTRAGCGLPDEGFVFCSFNNNFKLNRRFFAVWMDLLHRVPGSVLWLLQKTPEVRTNLKREAFAHGVDPDRIIFADQLPNDQHLARHAVADLFLDSLPCTAHTTASDALWAGLPLLTCIGHSFAGRVAASLLNAAGMPDLITNSIEAYAATALRLARNPDELLEIRARLAENRMSCALFDTPLYVRSLEAAYARMSAMYRAGEQPASFAIGAPDI